MYGPGGEVGIGLRNSERAIENIEGLHRVADVDNLRIRHNVQDHAFHRTHKVVVVPEIGGQGNDRTIRQGCLSMEDTVLLESRK